MYLSNQSEDYLPKTLISNESKLAETAVVAAPILKLWPAYSMKKEPCFFGKIFPSMKGVSTGKIAP